MAVQTKKRSSVIFIILGVLFAFCVICIVASFAMDSMGLLPTPMPTDPASITQPTAASSSPTLVSTESPVAKYLEEYGGAERAYLEILTSTDCAFLQEKFDVASDNNKRETPGTEGFKWTLGYMTAADDRMREIGCY